MDVSSQPPEGGDGVLDRAISGLREDLTPRRKFDWAVYGVVAALVLTLAVLALFGFRWADRGPLCAVRGHNRSTHRLRGGQGREAQVDCRGCGSGIVGRVDVSAGAHRSRTLSRVGLTLLRTGQSFLLIHARGNINFRIDVLH